MADIVKSDISQFVETKLTKTELIDLLISEAVKKVEGEIKSLSSQIGEINKSFTFDDVAQFMKNVSVSITEPYRSHDAEEGPVRTYRVSFGEIKADASKFSKTVLADLKRRHDLEKQKTDLQNRLSKLSDRKGEARNLILKGMLESSEQGRELLQLIAELQIRVQPKLLSA